MLAGFCGLVFFLQPRTNWQYQPVSVAHDPQPPLPLETATHPVSNGTTRLVAGAIIGRAYGNFSGRGVDANNAPIMLSHL